MKPHLISSDQWDEVDLVNPAHTEHKPNVHLAQSSPSINGTHLRYSEKSNPIVRRCWDTFFHSSLFIQFRFNLFSLLSQLMQNGKCMMTAYANTHTHSLFLYHTHKTASHIGLKLERSCGSLNHSATINTLVCATSIVTLTVLWCFSATSDFFLLKHACSSTGMVANVPVVFSQLSCFKM